MNFGGMERTGLHSLCVGRKEIVYNWSGGGKGQRCPSGFSNRNANSSLIKNVPYLLVPTQQSQSQNNG